MSLRVKFLSVQILQTPCRFHPDIGGVESYVRDVSKGMVRKGHDVTVICAGSSSHLPRCADVDGIRVERLDTVGKVADTNITPRLPIKLLTAARDADVIHTHLPTPWSADLSVLAGRMMNTPVVLTYHNDIIGDGFDQYIAQLYNKTALRLILHLTDRIIVTQEGYLSHSPYLEDFTEKITVIHNGVDTAEFRPADISDEEKKRLRLDPTRPNLFFLSVLDEYHKYKGLDTLLRAVQNMEQGDGQTPKLLVGGDGPLRSEYESTAIELGIAERVEFLGHVPQSSLRRLYCGTDLFVLPSNDSDQEGFGLVVLESLASGTPVITTNVVAVSDYIDTLDIGTVVEADNHEMLADAIADAISRHDRFKMERARELCERTYSWNASTEELLEIYSSL